MRPMATIEREALVTLTESAATKVKELMAEEPDGEATVLRVAVQGGGCSGFEYALGFDSAAQESDHQIDAFGVPVVVDPFSAPYLQGTEIDFLDGLQGGFAINNPNVSSACGCGHSFQVEEGAEGEMPSADAGCGSGCGA
jgi:iron-sulfur cluster assembly accessory protein